MIPTPTAKACSRLPPALFYRVTQLVTMLASGLVVRSSRGGDFGLSLLAWPVQPARRLRTCAKAKKTYGGLDKESLAQSRVFLMERSSKSREKCVETGPSCLECSKAEGNGMNAYKPSNKIQVKASKQVPISRLRPIPMIVEVGGKAGQILIEIQMARTTTGAVLFWQLACPYANARSSGRVKDTYPLRVFRRIMSLVPCAITVAIRLTSRWGSPELRLQDDAIEVVGFALKFTINVAITLKTTHHVEVGMQEPPWLELGKVDVVDGAHSWGA
ncbi:hypothetical protein Taro_018932 [Colocasia esculenta]|uniref:Uncharacterized protein n=1 Tax=Colocasia esculenta TaxID=4460 RepID=A0A843UXQ1_COLES|nr:hypothetical protein [Colocasia esculenta]